MVIGQDPTVLGQQLPTKLQAHTLVMITDVTVILRALRILTKPVQIFNSYNRAVRLSAIERYDFLIEMICETYITYHIFVVCTENIKL